MKHEEEIKLIRRLINETKMENDYRDTIIEYRYIPSKKTGLPYDIYIDDGNSYINHKHDLWLFVVIENVLHPVTISNNPLDIDNVLDDECFNEIKKFIKKNLSYLQLIANDKMDSSNFVCQLGTSKRIVAESLLVEMARIKKNITGLPCDIYVDNGTIHSGHENSPRIKFPPSKEYKLSTEFAPISLSAQPDFFPDSKEKFDAIVNGKLKKTIQLYIIKHLDDFLLQFRGEISVDELKRRLMTK